MILEIKYKNKTFGEESTQYVGTGNNVVWSEELVKSYILNNVHRYYGNEVLGHGEFEAEITMFKEYPNGYINVQKNEYLSRLSELQNQLSKINRVLIELDEMVPSEDVIKTYTITD